MIRIFHGADDYRVREAYRALRADLAARDDMLDSNTAVLDGRTLTPDELLAHVTAVPFLASTRLVVVDGLIAAMSQGRGRRKKGEEDPLERWRKAAAQLRGGGLPETTTLVLVEGDVRQEKTKALLPAFTIFGEMAQTEEFAPLDKGALSEWVRATAEERGVRLAPRSIAALVQLIGPNLWMLSTEIDRLGAYAAGESVEPELVSEIVSAAQETKIWDLTDAIADGNETKALVAMRKLIAEGQPTQVLLFMVVRQFRQLVLVKDMRERNVKQEDVARTAGIPNFRVNPTGILASRFSWPALRSAYARLLEADLNVKRNLQDDESSLQLLVHDLCALAARASRAPARSR